MVLRVAELDYPQRGKIRAREAVVHHHRVHAHTQTHTADFISFSLLSDIEGNLRNLMFSLSFYRSFFLNVAKDIGVIL